MGKTVNGIWFVTAKQTFSVRIFLRYGTGAPSLSQYQTEKIRNI